MKRYHLLTLLIGFLVLGSIWSKTLIKTSAQNSSNSNTTANRYYSNSSSNSSNAAFNTLPVRKPTPQVRNNDEDEGYPKVLKQISMSKKVIFPKNGILSVQTVQEVGQPFTVRFTDSNEKSMANFVMRSPGSGYISEYLDSAVDPKISVKVIKVEGFSSPLVHVVIVQPGGTDYGFWSALFGEVSGKIKLLTPPTTQFSWEGGVQIGNLGKGNGVGVAVWNSIWGDGESHYGDHIYQVEIYNFNQKLGKFVKTKELKTKQKYETPAKAMESLGLSFYKDAVRDFPEFLQYRENF
jgi:hypothetical protein